MSDAIEAARRIVAFNPLDGDWDDEMCEQAALVARSLLSAVEGKGRETCDAGASPRPSTAEVEREANANGNVTARDVARALGQGEAPCPECGAPTHAGECDYGMWSGSAKDLAWVDKQARALASPSTVVSDVLFIGGSADGLMVSMPHVMPTCVVTRPSEAAMSLGSPADVPSIVPTLRDLYYAEMLRVGETRFFLYRFDKLSMVDAVRVLIDGYSKKAKP